MRVAALAAALGAALLLPGEPLGVGVVLVALLVALAVAAARRPARETIAYGGAALVLASLVAVRDAAWVVALDLGAAWVLACVAVAGPRLAAAAAPFVSLGGAPSLVPPAPERAAPAARGAVFGLFLVAPFAALFWSADAAFAELGRSVPLPALGALPVRLATFVVVLAAAIGLALAARRSWAPLPLTPPRRLVGPEWVLPLALLDGLFAVFVAVQVAVLFGGHEHVLRSAGLTYAEYARRGFWQLLAVAALTLAVVGGARLAAHPHDPRERLLLRALLGTLCVLTLVVVASTLHRLELYEEAFGLTRLRLGAEALTLWVGAGLVLLLAAGAVGGVARRLPHVALAGSAVALVAFSLASPDARIAERNLALWRETGRLDLAYLGTLSADAAPVLVELPPPLRERALAALKVELAASEPWSSANLSRRRARALLRDDAATSGPSSDRRHESAVGQRQPTAATPALPRPASSAGPAYGDV